MIVFLLTFFSLYAALHLYLFIKIRGVVPLGLLGTSVFVAFMLVMTAAPVLIRVSERQGLDLFARIMSHIGYTWMGLIFLFFTCALAVDLYRFLVHLAGTVLPKPLAGLSPSPLVAFLLPVVVALSVATYGYFEALDVRNETLTITTPKISRDVGTLTIAQISDVHLGLMVGERRLRTILNKVRQAEPDIIVSTGDLVDGEICALRSPGELLKGVNPRYGKFAVTGNHEFYAGLDTALAFTENAGFTVLRGESITLPGIITIAGVDDIAGKPFGLYREISEKELLSGSGQDHFTLLLKHRPVVDEQARGLFDLQLSGHTHNGQLFPFTLLTRLAFPMYAGLYPLSENAYMYVNRGSGTWGPPIRFLSRPEVTIIRLVHSSEVSAALTD
jgi:hypothetical protein